MIFVRYEDDYDTDFTFSLDQVVSIDANGPNTRVELTNGRVEQLEIDIDDFYAKVFSDENMTEEYALVEIEGRKIVASNDPDGPLIDRDMGKQL